MTERHVAGALRLDDILARLELSLGALAGMPAPLSGGITNHNFRVTLGGADYVVRVQGKDTELLGIDRRAERLASGIAADMGIAPELVEAHEDCLVTRFVACDAVSPRGVADRVDEVARSLRAFHESTATLPTRFWVPELLEEYAARVRERGVRLPAAYGRAASIAARIAAVLPLRDPRPCHNDLLAGNIIRARGNGDAGEGELLIVDWEYAGMGHRCFDLGNLSVNNDFDEADDERLLRAYYGQPPSDSHRAALALMRIMSDAREGAWGVMQAEISDVDFDFDRYARTHFERLDAAVEQPRLPEWLAAAGAAALDTRETEGSDGQAA
jgi:thiamine kinase-like enzyme